MFIPVSQNTFQLKPKQLLCLQYLFIVFILKYTKDKKITFTYPLDSKSVLVCTLVSVPKLLSV